MHKTFLISEGGINKQVRFDGKIMGIVDMVEQRSEQESSNTSETMCDDGSTAKMSFH